MEKHRKRRRLALVLGRLQVFIAIASVPSGLIFILNPSGSGIGFSPELLKGTFLPNYLIPGLLLLGVNRIGSLLGGLLSFLRHRHAGEVGMALGGLMIAWFVVQLAIIGLMRSHPQTSFILAHLLGLELVADYADDLPNLYYHTSGGDPITPERLAYALDVFGPERLIVGSDEPFGSLDDSLARIRELPISDTERTCRLPSPLGGGPGWGALRA